MSNLFGFSTQPSSGEFTPILKYDARAGRMFRRDRIDIGGTWTNDEVDITSTFRAIADLENVEVGWISFSSGAPSFQLVPIGQQIPPRPEGLTEKGRPAYQNGVRLMVKLAKECGGDKPIREFTSNAKAFLSGLEALYADYLGQRDTNRGLLPIIILEKTVPLKTGSGDKASTNYSPVFKIVGWAPRGDLVFIPKSQAVNGNPVKALNASPDGVPRVENGRSGNPVSESSPPSTGAERVGPPTQTASVSADMDDFG